MAMNQLERYKATVSHKRPDNLLFNFGCTPDLASRLRNHLGLTIDKNINEHFQMYSGAWASMERPKDYPLPDFSRYYKDGERPEGSRIDGNGCLHIPGSMYHFTHLISPLRNALSMADIESYPWPDYSRYTTDHVREIVNKAHAAGQVARVHCTHMYEDAWQVRGYEEFLMDMIAEPDWAHFILDRFMERNKLVAVAAARAGADELVSGDDVANQNSLMFSIEHWREFIKAKWAEVYAAARAIKPDIQIWYHSDGNITEIIPELLEIGVTVFNPLQPECVDVAEIKRKFGDRMVMHGTIGTQTTMPFGTPDDVRACVKQRVETLGSDGALILSPTHTLEPEVPIENILAFVDACKEFGKR
jgi:uroporphyrinogen decarboxylase